MLRAAARYEAAYATATLRIFFAGHVPVLVIVAILTAMRHVEVRGYAIVRVQ